MSSITLTFVSFQALAAALPYLEKTPGLVTHGSSAIAGNAVAPATSSPVTTAPSAPTAVAAPVAAPEQKAAPSAPSVTFDQVKAALAAYNQRDGAAFASAMQRFGFNSFEAIQAAPGKWDELMSYIGATPAAAPAPTIEQVGALLQAWAKTDSASFASYMQANGLTDMNAVAAAPAKWADIVAAAAAKGIK